MNDSGVQVMASGNLLKWERTTLTGRGGIKAFFSGEPSNEDVKEGQEFVMTLAPASAARAVSGVFHGTKAEMTSTLDDFLYGGQRN